MNTTTQQTAPKKPNLIVHHEGFEGAIELDAETGIVQTAIDQRPEWANGLTCGLLHERTAYYFGGTVSDGNGGTKEVLPRLDRDRFEKDLLGDKPIAFQDLGWLAVTEEGQTVELEADLDFRMQQTADLLGVDREDAEGLVGYEQEVAADQTRSQADVETLTEMKEAGFGNAEAAEERKTAQG